MVAQGKESAARCGGTRMAGERINNPATKWRTKCNGFALLFWEQEERFDSDVFHHAVARCGKCSCCGSPFKYGAGHHSKLPVGI